MKKVLFAAAIALGALGATSANAQEVVPSLEGFGVVVNNELEYSIENETILSEPELVLAHMVLVYMHLLALMLKRLT